MHQNPENTVTRKYQSTPCRQVPAPGFGGATFFHPKTGYIFGTVFGALTFGQWPDPNPGVPAFGAKRGHIFGAKVCPFLVPLFGSVPDKNFHEANSQFTGPTKNHSSGTPRGYTRTHGQRTHKNPTKKCKKVRSCGPTRGQRWLPLLNQKRSGPPTKLFRSS